jgi:hypothetical protein
MGIVLVLTSGLASAGFSEGNYTMQKVYSGGELIKGYLNISFSGQTNSNFTNSFSDGIDLLRFLKSSDLSYQCVPSDCKDGYGSPSSTSKSFYLSGDKLFAFATGSYNETKATNLKFNITSDFGPSCKASQFYIDLFDDGSIDFFNNKNNDVACDSKNYGCFDSSLGDDKYNWVYIASNTKLCEKISLAQAPAYRVGAKIKNGTSNIKIIVTLYDMSVSNSSAKGYCQLPSNTDPVQEKDCVVNYSSYKRFDGLVCISADTSSGSTDFQIRAETTSPKCGTSFDNVGKGYPVDYELYAFPLQYAAVNNIGFNSNVYSKLNGDSVLTSALTNYVGARYGNVNGYSDCSDKCVIPFRIWGSAQNINIDNIVLSYSSPQLGGETSDSNLYSITSTKFKINTDWIQIDLKDLAINAPYFNGRKLFELNFADKNLISEMINISGGFSFDVNPKIIAVGRNVEFIIDVGNVTSSIWDFGDSSEKVTSSTGRTVHKYSTSGDYEVTVQAVKSNGESSTRTFKISVGDAKTSAETTFSEYKIRLLNLTSQLNSYPDWIKVELKKNVNIPDLNESLDSIEVALNKASSDSDYEKVLNNLSKLNMPYGIYSTSAGRNLPILLGFNGIDLKYIQQIAQSEVTADSATKLRADLVNWIKENYDANVSYETISEVLSSGAEPILTKFKISLTPKVADSEDTNYLIVGVPENSITFLESYSVKSLDEGSGLYIDFMGAKNVEFYIKGKMSLEDIGAYISPEISKLGVYEYIQEPTKPKFRTRLFLIGIIVILVLFLIVYIILQEWYKKNYENSLFKSKNDLFNLINFIYNSRTAGLKDRDIKRKLESSGWSGEQVNYAFKKIDGQRTGMWEIPLFSFLEKGKVKKEIEKMHPEGVDTRFINQSNF